MRSEKLYLQDMIDAADAIEKFLDGVSEDDFRANELVQSAILHKMTLIGEAATKISRGLQSRYGHVAWRAIKGFRNIVVHEYFAVNWKIIWTTANADVTTLRSRVVEILTLENAKEHQESDFGN